MDTYLQCGRYKVYYLHFIVEMAIHTEMYSWLIDLPVLDEPSEPNLIFIAYSSHKL